MGFQKGKNRNQSRTWTFWDLRDGKITLSNLGQLESESFFWVRGLVYVCVYTHSQKERPFFFFFKKREKGTLPTPPRNLISLGSFKNSLAHWLWHCCFSHPSSQDTWFFFERLVDPLEKKGAKKRFPGQSRVGHCSLREWTGDPTSWPRRNTVQGPFTWSLIYV